MKASIVFEPFCLDAANECLWRGDQLIKLNPKDFAVLHYLLTHPGRLISKEELLEAVWPQTYVSDSVLKVSIRSIRKALEDDAKVPQFIETLHRRGYRFIGSIGKRKEGFGLTNIVGRESELDRLQARMQRSLVGERQLIFITGNAGIGKSTLVASFLNGIESSGIRIASGQCLEGFGAGEAFMPVLETLSRLCRGPDGERLILILQKYAPTWLRELPFVSPRTEHTPFTSRERMLRELAEAIEIFAAETPVVLVFEDLHWSDPSTLDLIRVLAQRRENARLAVLGTYRPDESQGHLKKIRLDMERHGCFEELRLGPLTQTDVIKYIEKRFPEHQFSKNFPKMLFQRTEGHPLFLVSSIDDLVNGQTIVQRHSQWIIAEGMEFRVPGGIASMIEQQIERLEETDRKILESASVCGVEFNAAVVSALLEADPVSIEERCHRLARDQRLLLIAGETEFPDTTISARYAYQHAIYREVLYNRIPPTKRAQLHHKMATWLETMYANRRTEIAAELAMHFECGRKIDRAVEYLLLAADNAAKKFAAQESIQLLQRGLNLLSALPDSTLRAQVEMQLQMMLGLQLQITRGFADPGVEHCYARALALCDRAEESHLRFQILWGVWMFSAVRGKHRDSLELAKQLLQIAEQSQTRPLLLQAHSAIQLSLLQLGEFANSRLHMEKALELYDAEQNRQHAYLFGQDPAVASLGFGSWALWALGEPDKAQENAQKAVDLAEHLSHPHSMAVAHYLAGAAHQRLSDPKAVQHHAEKAIHIATEGEFAFWHAGGTILRGWAMSQQGNAEQGILQMREGIDSWRKTGAQANQAYHLSLLADVLNKQGRIKEALAAVREALSIVAEKDERLAEIELYCIQGELFAKNRMPAKAEASIRNAMEFAQQRQAKTLLLRAKKLLRKIKMRIEH